MAHTKSQARPQALSAAPVEPETDEDVAKKAVANHFYLGESLTDIVEDEEDAHGIRYVVLGAEDKPLNWHWTEASEDERKMMAVFGAKTLATNESSQIRNNKKIKGTDAASPGVQAQAVLDRFALIRSGQWVDRTREPGGVRVDKDVFARAVAEVKAEAGKIRHEDLEQEVATVRQRIDDDAAYLKMARTKAPVQAAYARLIAAKAGSVSLDDL